MDFLIDDPTQLSNILALLRDRPWLLHRHDQMKKESRERLGDSDTHPANASLDVHTGKIHLDKNIIPSGALTLIKQLQRSAQDVNTLAHIHDAEGRWVGHMHEDRRRALHYNYLQCATTEEGSDRYNPVDCLLGEPPLSTFSIPNWPALTTAQDRSQQIQRLGGDFTKPLVDQTTAVGHHCRMLCDDRRNVRIHPELQHRAQLRPLSAQARLSYECQI